jgi:signal transduction histidine kinase/DNA-binding response OmpR family regulator
MAGPKANILIVDDLPEKLLVYQTVLEELEQNIVAVRSGAEALRQVLKEDFAVILLDVHMPGIDGFETAQLIRQRKRSAHTPIIFLTTFADEVRIQQGYATGGVDYIPAPVIPAILRAKVRVFVELFHMRQQMALQAEEQAKRAAAEETARRSTFLADASRALAATLDLEATLQTLARVPVPQLGDACLVTLRQEHGKETRTMAAWIDPATNELAPAELTRHVPADLAHLIDGVLASGRRDFRDDLAALPCEPSQNGTGPQADGLIALQSALVLPLIARGHILGAVAFANASARPPRQAADVWLAEELSGRAAVALDNAMLVRDIQESDRRKNEFLAMLAHELRNPLAPIRNAVHLLRLHGSEKPDFAWARDVIDRQVTNLVRMVDDLLDVARINRGKIQLSLETLDVEKLVSGAVETSRPAIDAHGHSLTVVGPPTPLAVRGDATRLSQVLSNLLNNAAKYTPDGGQIELRVEREGDEVVVRVRDNGPGIAPELLSKIFDLFTQVDRSLDRSQGGLGIGLTLVRRLVEMHGGSVHAMSEGEGRGSEFVVRLPTVAVEPPLAVAPSAPSAQRHAALRVLVVDDNVDVAESLAMVLRLTGHEVRMANDGLTALDAAQEFHPQVVLLDIGLPGLNGFEVARQLRVRSQAPRPLLIAISGYGQNEEIQKSLEAGFDHHLIKPVAPTVLERLLAGAPNGSSV